MTRLNKKKAGFASALPPDVRRWLCLAGSGKSHFRGYTQM
jgi:hypothetical protein